jgi:pyruvate/2-oxoglutarate/acetoin dehydrogenase E1 component
MNANKHIRALLRSVSSDVQILCESPESTPFLKGLQETKSTLLKTLPCSDESIVNIAVGMAISGSKVLVCMSTDKGLPSLFALLSEESYGEEFPLPITFLVPSHLSYAQQSSHNLIYCQTGSQLLGHLKKSIDNHSANIICYYPGALFDSAQDEEAKQAHVHQQGTHISLFSSGTHIDAAKEFAHTHSDVEVVELISLHPLCTTTIAQSVQKTGRVLLLDTPPSLTKEILDSCFWHLEAQPEYTHNSDQSNLSRLRARLLEN